MPMKPGRESTRKTLPSTEGLMVASFIMEFEEHLWRRFCVIKDCEHRMGPRRDELASWESCDRNHLPAFVVHEKRIDVNLGMACPHHVGEILAR